MTLTELSTLMLFTANTFKWLHWNTRGREFIYIHEHLDEYWGTLQDYVDELAELALENDEPCVNPNTGAAPGTYIEEPDIPYDRVIEVAGETLDLLLEGLDAVLSAYPDASIQNSLQNIHQDVSKEAHYKLWRMRG